MTDLIKKTLESLKRSSFRAHFTLSDKDLIYVREKSLETIHQQALDFITTHISPQWPENDGKQTPLKNHPVFIAQHATATCCRGCISKWHKFPKGRALSEEEITFIVNLIMRWIEEQIGY